MMSGSCKFGRECTSSIFIGVFSERKIAMRVGGEHATPLHFPVDILFHALSLPSREREILLVDFFPLLEIRMQVDLGCLYGRMAKVLLDDTEILGTPVQFTCIAMTDLVRSDPFWSIFRNICWTARGEIL